MYLCFMLFYPFFVKSLAKAWGPTKARPKTRMKGPIGPLSQPSECSAHNANLQGQPISFDSQEGPTREGPLGLHLSKGGGPLTR